MTWNEQFKRWHETPLGNVAVKTWTIFYHHTGRLDSEPGQGTAEFGAFDEVINNALVRGITERELNASAGQYQNGDILVRLQTTDVKFPCQPNDRFLYGDDWWQVLRVDLLTFGQRWQLMARRIEAA